nr:hypothetical protein [Tanacetum cinerariifolium]
MTLTFADTHNMVAYLSKSDASEGFDQIINFINGSYIAYALTVNPTIYVSCIKQFWRTVAIKSSNDVTRLQALVDKKKVVVTEATIRDALNLDDAEGIDCLPNEEIFATLDRMGYEKPSTKLTFYKAFFSSQWKFLIHTILQSMSAKRTSWNEFSSAMALDVICLAIGRTFNFSKYIFESLVRNVDSSSKFYMYPRFIILIIHNQLCDLSNHSTKYTSPALTQKVFANMRREGKGCSGVEMPLFEGMIAARELKNQVNAEEQGAKEEHGNGNNATKEPVTTVDDVIAQSTQSPTPLTPPPQQPPDIPSTSQKVGASQRIESSANTIEDVSNQERMTEESDKDEGAKVVNEEEETEEVRDNAADAKVEGRQADIYHIDMDHAAKMLSMQEEEPEVQEAVEVVTTAKLITKVVAAVSGTVIAAAVIPAPVTAATISPAPVKVVVPATRRKGIEEEESRAIALINETPAQKAAKRRRLNKEAEDVEELKKHLEIMPDEDDDVFTEATPLARKIILIVERRYPLSKFTLEQMINVVRLQVEEQSEMSLELIRFTRQQRQEGMSYDDIRPIFEAKFNANLEFLLKSKEQMEEEESRAIALINETPAQKSAKRRRLNKEAEDVEELKKHLEIVPDEDDIHTSCIEA